MAVLTQRGRVALVLAGMTYVTAWAFGAAALYPLAIGLAAAVGAAWALVAFARAPMALHRRLPPGEQLEGSDVAVTLELELARRVPGVSVRVRERISRLGSRVTELHGAGRTKLSATYVLRGLPRGRYAYEGAAVAIGDSFGLAQAEIALPERGALLVYPRLVEVEHLFSDRGTRTPEGRRLLLRRPSGFDVHSVREYEQGESLRKVHWRSTAKRGKLMVKELEDAPRDEVAVVLDAHEATRAADPGLAAFDASVRAAGSLLRACVRRGRSGVLMVTSSSDAHLRVQSETQWRAALDLLAAAEPLGRRSAAGVLAAGEGPAGRALEVAVVTSFLSAELENRLVQRALGGGSLALVYVDAGSFAGAHGRTADRALLRVAAAGVPVAVFRRGDDLSGVLSATIMRPAAHA